jgi:DNA polymerase I
MTEKEVCGSGQKKTSFAESPIDFVSDFSNQFSSISLKLFKIFQSELQRLTKLNEFYQTIELPLVKTLSEIEIKGVCVDKESFCSMEKEYDEKIKILSEKIIQESETPDLNINSPHQVFLILIHMFSLVLYLSRN